MRAVGKGQVEEGVEGVAGAGKAAEAGSEGSLSLREEEVAAGVGLGEVVG